MRIHGAKLVTSLAIALVVFAILTGFRLVPVGELVFTVPGADAKPWTALTYPLVGGLIVAFLNAIGLVSIGSAIERDIGPAKTAFLLVTVTLLGAVGTQLGATLLSMDSLLASSWLWVSAMMVAFGTRYPRQPIQFMGVVTIEARWLAWGSLVLDLAAVTPTAVAPFTLISMLFVWAFAANKLSFFPYGKPLADVRRPAPTGRGAKPQSESYFDDVRRREKEREEKERLRKLFESSVDDSKNE